MSTYNIFIFSFNESYLLYELTNWKTKDFSENIKLERYSHKKNEIGKYVAGWF